MRLLADENFPGDAIIALHRAGYDVLWMRTAAPGSSDPQVMAQAQTEDRILRHGLFQSICALQI
ncbi:MAG: DUF5615 family PIN-like protein [Chloroflexi bacterium]|nr:DUF5615 family PIN-like protein [Chloroflexota bacterium]